MVFPPLRVLLRLFLLFNAIILPQTTALNVALFPSTGCYSHDVMMRQVGEEFGDQSNVTWIQTFLYEFGFGEMPLPTDWTRISIWGHDEEGIELMNTAGKLLWEQNVPTDFDRPWDLRGSLHFIKILERHQRYCEKMITNERFLKYMREQKTDVVVLDHFLQECIGGLAHLLNASTIQFSNWPIADGYVTSLNIPANPSATPKTGTPYSGLGMSFFERVSNFLFHSIIILARIIQVHILDAFFARHGFSEVKILQTEADRTIYAGRSEFLFDVVRPINNRIKHFGGANCMDPRDYVIALPPPSSLSSLSSASSVEASGNKVIYLDGPIVSNGTLPLSLKSCLSCDSSCDSRQNITSSHLLYRSHMYEGHTAEIIEERMLKMRTKFPGIDWERIGEQQFILVSFGSVAKVENMPISLLRKLLRTFETSKYDVIWQTNSAMEEILEVNNITLPENTRIVSWAPIKELLSHPNLQYIVCHGGINTMNELLLFGVPVIGVPLQGDQGSNLRRLADLGAAEVVPTVRLKEGGLAVAMRKMEANLNRYWQRASKISSMVSFYRRLHRNDQQFWFQWTARNGKKLRDRNLFKMKYIGDEENIFWFSIAALILIPFAFLLS